MMNLEIQSEIEIILKIFSKMKEYPIGKRILISSIKDKPSSKHINDLVQSIIS